MVSDVGEEVALNRVGFISLSECVKLLRHICFSKVIRFDKVDVLSSRHFEANVHRIAVTDILLGHDLYALVNLPILFQNLRRGIGGSVIEANDLNVVNVWEMRLSRHCLR